MCVFGRDDGKVEERHQFPNRRQKFNGGIEHFLRRWLTNGIPKANVRKRKKKNKNTECIWFFNVRWFFRSIFCCFVYVDKIASVARVYIFSWIVHTTEYIRNMIISWNDCAHIFFSLHPSACRRCDFRGNGSDFFFGCVYPSNKTHLINCIRI